MTNNFAYAISEISIMNSSVEILESHEFDIILANNDFKFSNFCKNLLKTLNLQNFKHSETGFISHIINIISESQIEYGFTFSYNGYDILCINCQRNNSFDFLTFSVTPRDDVSNRYELCFKFNNFIKNNEKYLYLVKNENIRSSPRNPLVLLFNNDLNKKMFISMVNNFSHRHMSYQHLLENQNFDVKNNSEYDFEYTNKKTLIKVKYSDCVSVTVKLLVDFCNLPKGYKHKFTIKQFNL